MNWDWIIYINIKLRNEYIRAILRGGDVKMIAFN